MRAKQLYFLLLFCLNIGSVYSQDSLSLQAYEENLKTIDVYIQGKKYSFLFDTGGGETTISPEIARVLNKNTYGSLTGFRMSGDIIKTVKANGITMKIGHTEIFHPSVAVLDIMSLLPKEFPRIDGLISLKTFENQILTLDLARNTLYIESEKSAVNRIKGKQPIESRFANGLTGTELNIFIGIPKNNFSYWFLFDSGNSGPLLLSNETALQWGLRKSKLDSTINKSSVNILLGKSNFRAVPFFRDIIYEGVLNWDSMAKFVFTIDFKRKQVWMNSPESL
ncbi:aspartyl protease family protein [Pedobacter gandavensis]|nr:aspartyl protease family protein [Pedobacter gandavensis]